MNIRKIILEEINDFEWAEDIPPPSTLVTDDDVHIGMRVMIAKSSEYYRNWDEDNPINTPGSIIDVPDVLGQLSVGVEWDNGVVNGYDVEDLVTTNY